MDQKAGAQISKKAFIQSALILLLLMIIAGVLTRVLPTGLFERQVVDGRTLIPRIPTRLMPQPGLPDLALVHRPDRGAVGTGRPDRHHHHRLHPAGQRRLCRPG